MATTRTGVDNDDNGFFETTQDAADALVSRWTDAGKLSASGEEAPRKKAPRETEPSIDEEDESEEEYEDLDDQEDDDEGTEEDPDGEDSDADDDDEDDSGDDEAPTEASDDAVVKIKVGEEERTVSVKDLKRLYGQEASLTRKSQEVAEARKKAEDDGARFTVAAQKLLEKAQERFAPYANLDWLVVQQQLSVEEFAALRQEARAAYEDVQFLTQEVDSVFEQVTKARQAELHEAAKKAVEVLTQEIPGWNQEVYNNIRNYAVSQGLEADVVDTLVDPYAIKLIYKAMKFDSAQNKVKTKKMAAPKKVIKTSNKSAKVLGKKPTAQDEMKRLAKTGSRDDAVAVLMARWGAMDDNDI